MSTFHRRRRTLASALLLATCLTAVGAAHAQTAPQSAPESTPESTMVKLIRALVQKGTLDAATGAMLIQAAQAESHQAQAPAPSTAVAALPASGEEDGQHIQYVPQIVQDQLREQVKQELTEEARDKGWIAPDAMPAWVRKIAIGGDFRVRDENDFYSKNNALDFVNVGAINSGSAYNIDTNTNPFNPPELNSQQPRQFANMRFRLTLDAQVAGDIDFHGRLASGSDNQPVSTNQTLGGYFTKDAIWLDRAYMDWHPIDGLHLYGGRMANPMRASDLVWDEDVNPDGFAASYERPLLGDRLSAYLTTAAFSLSYIGANTPTDAPGDAKISSNTSKFIYAVQGGGAYKISDALTAHLNADYYYYDHIEGALSPSCENTADYCLTDYTMPGYMQKGNTVFALRDLVSTTGTTNSPQYFGLASKFQVLEFSGDIGWKPTDNFKATLSANFADNLGYNIGNILNRAYNADSGLSQLANNQICPGGLVGGVCSGPLKFQSGKHAFQIRAAFGTPEISKFGDWSFSAMYKYIEPDALLDAFTDQDFHMGGTNAKGFVLIGTLGVRQNTNVSIRYFDADQVFGPRFAIDVLQADLNAKF